MGGLFAKKTIGALLEEAKETGQHSLKADTRSVQLTALGVGAVMAPEFSFCPGLVRITPGRG